MTLLRLAEAACIVIGTGYLLYAVTLYVTYRFFKGDR